MKAPATLSINRGDADQEGNQVGPKIDRYKHSELLPRYV